MAFKTILVSLNDVARSQAMIDAAAMLADLHGAHLIGYYVIPAITIYPEVGFAAASAVDDARQRYFKSNLEEVRERFESKLRQDGINGEWRAVESLYPAIAPSVLDNGRSTDLIMVSQVAGSPVSNIEDDVVERLVMESGRPVLVIPQDTDLRKVDSAVVGFNASKEAARALFESIPLLQGASDVRVVWVDPYKERGLAGEIPGAEVTVALARHGVKATAESLTAGNMSAGQALLLHVNDLGAQLLVMGAYAHSRLREYVFGGATRYVLEHATVPVLMSH